MEKKKFKKPIKDSILITKTKKYTIESNETQRRRFTQNYSIYRYSFILFFLGITDIVSDIRRIITSLCINQSYMHHSYNYTEIYLGKCNQFLVALDDPNNLLNVLCIANYLIREIILACILISFSVLQCFSNSGEFNTNCLPCIVILTIYILSAFMNIYLILQCIVDYAQLQKNTAIREALKSKESFNENLKKSISIRTNKTADDYYVSIQNQSSLREDEDQ